MKKIISLFMSLLIFIGSLIQTVGFLEVSAAESSSEKLYNDLRDNSISYSCVYDREKRKMNISGTVNHDIMISHNDHFLQIYSIPPGSTFDEVISDEESKPLVNENITVKFDFSVSVEDSIKRFSKFAVVLRAPDGQVYLTSEPKYAYQAFEPDLSDSTRSEFKGIASKYTSSCGDLGAGTVIIPIYLDGIFNSGSSGYIYQIDDTHCYFDKTYIDELDAKVRTYSAAGTKVYLQVLLNASYSDLTVPNVDTRAEYCMPDIYSGNVLQLICACSEFLAHRYSAHQSGSISGMILGKQIDKSFMNYSDKKLVDDYAAQYAFYLITVANSARYYLPSLEMVIPFSDVNGYTMKNSETITDYSPSVLLEKILYNIDEAQESAFKCITMLETSASPLGMNSDNFASLPIKVGTKPSDETINVQNVSIYSNYLNSIKTKFDSAPMGYMYVWNVSEDIRGTALACAYSYSYYKMFSESLMRSYVVSLYDAEKNGSDCFFSIEKIIRYIDTDRSFENTEHLLPFFGVTSWDTLIEDIDEKALVLGKIYRHNSNKAKTRAWIGNFSYYDFASGDISGWFRGSYCKDVKSSYDKNGQRVLRADLAQANSTERADVLYIMEYPENLKYTPDLQLLLSISDLSDISSSLYKIIITIGNDDAVMMSEHIVHGNEKTNILLNISEYTDMHMADYIKISTAKMSEKAEEYSLLLYDIKGYSMEYDSNTLARLIEEERLNIRDLFDDSENEEENNTGLLKILVMIFFFSAISVGLLVCFRYRAVSMGAEEKNSKDDST